MAKNVERRVYVVFRFDGYKWDPNRPDTADAVVTVKRVLETELQAIEETRRLCAITPAEYYAWQYVPFGNLPVDET